MFPWILPPPPWGKENFCHSQASVAQLHITNLQPVQHHGIMHLKNNIKNGLKDGSTKTSAYTPDSISKFRTVSINKSAYKACTRSLSWLRLITSFRSKIYLVIFFHQLQSRSKPYMSDTLDPMASDHEYSVMISCLISGFFLFSLCSVINDSFGLHPAGANRGSSRSGA
jgi:hypothetical protein